MCLSCGCGKPHTDHGDKRNITQEDLQKAADASNISLQKAAANIVATLKKTGTSVQKHLPSS
jgi:hypothetical protein